MYVYIRVPGAGRGQKRALDLPRPRALQKGVSSLMGAVDCAWALYEGSESS